MKCMTEQFVCEACGKKLEARTTASRTGSFGKGGYQAKCPACGAEQGNYPEKVIEVVEVSPEE